MKNSEKRLCFVELNNGTQLVSDGTFLVPGRLALPADRILAPVFTDGGLTILQRRVPYTPVEVYQRCGRKHRFFFHPVQMCWEQAVETHNGVLFSETHWHLAGFGAVGPVAFLPGGECRLYGRRLLLSDIADDLSLFGFPATFANGYLQVVSPAMTLHLRYDTNLKTWLTKREPVT